MGDVPVIVFLVPVIGLALVAYMVFARKRAVAGYDQQFAAYRAAALAERLRLRLVEGDPTFNFFITQANVDVERGPRDGQPLHVQVRMEGAPDGVELSLTYLYRIEQETGLTTVRWRVWFDCRMTAQARQPFPPFEVASRTAPAGPIVRTEALAPRPTGSAAADATYLVATAEPRMAEVLGTLLPAFDTFANSGVHLVGDGKSVSFVMKQDRAPLLANALYYAEAMAAGLVRIARAVGG